MELIYGGTFEPEAIDRAFMARCVYMHCQASTGLGGPGVIEWITGDGTRWIVGMESVEAPEHLFLRRFPELDAVLRLLGAEDRPPMLWSETIRWMKKNTKTDLRLEPTGGSFT